MSTQGSRIDDDPATETSAGDSKAPARGVRGLFHRYPRARAGAVGLAVVLLAGGFFLWRYLSVRESTDDAFVDGPIVSTAFSVSGTVAEVHVHTNQQVTKGELLAELDSDDYRLALARAEADLAAAQAAVAAAEAQVPIAATNSSSGRSAAAAQMSQARAAASAAEQGVKAAEARLESERANLEKATQDVRRYEQLVAKNEIARQTYEHAVTAERSARAAVAEAEQQVALAESRRSEAEAMVSRSAAGVEEAGSGPHQVEASRAQVRLAEAHVAQARAARDLAKSQLEDTRLVAAVTGRVGRKNLEVGETVQAGQAVLALVPLADVWITANFKETQIADIRPGQVAIVHVDA
ncbi:MAG: HlyD family secretion protein, partial [Acidobacteria bacterium]|nr:HlyD family secretion protein [Acidobacteriota bacterium]